jgi:hypothetical protein
MAEPKGQKAARDRFAESVRSVIEQARQKGVTSFHGLADYLTERGIRPVTGKVEWSNAMVARLLARPKCPGSRPRPVIAALTCRPPTANDCGAA